MTLIEVLVVTGLTVLLGAIGFPAMDRLGRGMAFEAARATLVADLKAARGRAVRTGRPVRLRIAADGARYVWFGGEVTLPDGVRMRADRIVGFYGDGSSSGATVTLARADERRRVSVAAATGIVR